MSGEVWTLDAVIRQVESAGNGRVTRFEAALFQARPSWVLSHIFSIIKCNECSSETATQIACTSYGFYQILGANIWELGFNGSEFDFRNDPSDFTETLAGGCQQATFAKFIEPEGFVFAETVSGWTDQRFLKFASFYNGAGDPTGYANRMKTVAGLPPIVPILPA